MQNLLPLCNNECAYFALRSCGFRSGVERGPVVAERDAEAAVAAAKEAACQQQEQALQRCNAEWNDRLGKTCLILCAEGSVHLYAQ